MLHGAQSRTAHLGSIVGWMAIGTSSWTGLTLANGAMTAGIPVMPVSPAYSLMSQDHEKLKMVIGHNDFKYKIDLN